MVRYTVTQGDATSSKFVSVVYDQHAVDCIPISPNNQTQFGGIMSRDELQQIVIQRAERMTPAQRRRFIFQLNRLARAGTSRENWLLAAFGDEIDGAAVRLWRN